MPPKHCCCTGCDVADDNFDRTNANPPSGNWSVISGEWEILSNELKSITDGPIITTVQPPPPAAVGARYCSRILVDLVIPASGNATFGVICAYRSSSDYDWIKFEYDGTTGRLEPTFYTGVTTEVMSVTTHPGNDVWTPSPGANFSMLICVADVEWTATNNGLQGDIVWHNCTPVGLTSLATGLGAIGFRTGRFDNWEYDVHWESDRNCLKCECFCLNPLDGTDYTCIPECLTLTITRDNFYVTCCIDNLVVTLHLSNPDTSGPTPVFNLSSHRKRWYSDLFQCPEADSSYMWFVLTCDSDGVLALSLLNYPNLDPSDVSQPVFMPPRSLPDTVTCNPILFEYFGVLSADVTTCDILDEFGTPIRTGTKSTICDGCWETGTEPQPTWSVTITECV